MAGCYGDHLRHVILLVATACLSMMLANCLTFNFTILCMTKVEYGYEDFTVDVRPDFINNLEIDLSRFTPSLPSTTTAAPGFRLPDFGINTRLRSEGDRVLLRSVLSDPELLRKLIAEGLLKLGKVGVNTILDNLDPTKFDLNKLSFSMDILTVNSTRRLIDYVTEVLQQQRPDYRNATIPEIETIEITNITWSGTINGRRRYIIRPADYTYTNGERSILFAAIAVGALLAILPVTIGIHKRGARTTFTIVCTISCIATALCPLAASLGFWPFVFVRAIQGIGFAACMPVIGAVTATWAELTEAGLFSGALTSFIQLAPVITMPLSGLLCESSLRWPAVFYVHAGITAVLTAGWWIVYRDIPNRHPQIGHAELRLIRKGKSAELDKHEENEPLPISQICTSLAVWAIWIAAIGNMYAVQTVVMFAPTFLNVVLGFRLVDVGFSAAAPTLLQFAVKMSAGAISDRLRFIGETAKVKCFNAIAFLGMGLFMIALALTPASRPHLALGFLIACTAILGFNVGGFFKSSPLVARQYSQFVNAMVQVIMCIAMLTVPFFVYALTPDNTANQWRWVFVANAGLLFAATVVFSILGSGMPADFVGKPAVIDEPYSDQPEKDMPLIAKERGKVLK